MGALLQQLGQLAVVLWGHVIDIAFLDRCQESASHMTQLSAAPPGPCTTASPHSQQQQQRPEPYKI